MSEKPELIRYIERESGYILHESSLTDKGEFPYQPWGNRAYVANKKGEITALSLDNINPHRFDIRSILSQLSSLTFLRLQKTDYEDFDYLKELPQLQSLDLSSNINIEDFSFLSQLTQLQSLDLSSNIYMEDFSFLSHLTQLQSLDLSSNISIEDFSFLSQLTQLQSLDLSNNRLSDVSFLSQLTQLQSLNLSFNLKIEDFSFLSQLTQLQSLDLSYHQVSDISFLSQLTQLQSLSLTSNLKIEDFSFLSQLTQLQSLDLSSNQQIEDFSFLSQLTQLRSLSLSINQVSDVSFLSQLTQLQYLYLSNNQQIEDFSFLSQLTQLQSLDLRSSQVSDVSFLSQLTQLQSLFLSDNQVSDVSFLSQLTQLQYLSLSDNPIQTPPPEVVEKGLVAIQSYLKQLKSQKEAKLFEARVLFVGQPGAGKTSLMKKLINPAYPVPNEETVSTVGIDIHKGWAFPCPSSPDGEFLANFWDFGGQEVQYHLHQFFLSSRALYVLLADDRRQDTEFDYWFDVIQTLGGGSPVLVVLNENKHRSISNFDHESYRDRYAEHFLIEKREVDLAEIPNPRLEHLRGKICSMLLSLDHIGDPLPGKWVSIRERIEKEAEKENHITWSRFQAICQEEGLEEEAYQLQLSGYLHDLGILLHFQESDLIDFVILRPDWALKAIYEILDDTYVHDQKGRFSKSWLFKRWGKAYGVIEKNKILGLMGKDRFDLVYPLEGQKEGFLAPYLLPETDPAPHWDHVGKLRYRYQYSFMPRGLLARLIVRMSDNIAENEDGPIIWHKGAIFQRGDNYAKVSEDRTAEGLHVIDISIEGEGQARKDFLTLLREEIPKLHGRFNKLTVNQLIPCNCELCAKAKTPKFYTKREIERHLEGNQDNVYCTESLQMVPIKDLIYGVVSNTGKGITIGWEWQDSVKRKSHEILGVAEDDLISLLDKSKRAGGSRHQETVRPTMLTHQILFLASSPSDNGRKRMDEEYRGIQDSLRGAKIRDQIKLKSKFALRRKDINRAILDESPNIVHFAGGGNNEAGIQVLNRKEELKTLSPNALGGLFELFEENIECVILNACYSEAQAESISKYIPYVIGMSAEIGDEAAVEFAEGFYDALGNGRDIEFAFKMGRNAIDLEGLPKSAVPILLKRE